jgi:hypothetical protein
MSYKKVLDHRFYQDYKLMTETLPQLVTKVAKEGVNV